MATTWNDSMNASCASFQLQRRILPTWTCLKRSSSGHSAKWRGQVAEGSLQRLGVGVEVDEHEATPRTGPHHGQRPVVGRSAGSPTGTGMCLSDPSRFQAMPWNEQRSSSVPPRVLLQHTPAMPADVAVGRDRVGGGPDDEHRDAGDLVVEVIADLGDVFLAAGHLPHPLPHRLDLDTVELGRRVPRHRDPQLVVTHRCLPPVHIGHAAASPRRASAGTGLLGWWRRAACSSITRFLEREVLRGCPAPRQAAADLPATRRAADHNDEGRRKPTGPRRRTRRSCRAR